MQANPKPFHPVPERTAAADAHRLREAVARLRPVAQDIVYLRYFLELSEAETAVRLARSLTGRIKP